METFIDSTGYNGLRPCSGSQMYCDGMCTKCKRFDFESSTTATPNKEECQFDVIS